MAEHETANFHLFARIVAHDFNNLLAGILGHASLIEAIAESQEVRESAATIRKASERAVELTRQLLHYSGDRPVRFAPVDLHETITEVASLVAGSPIRVTRRLKAARATVAGDAGQLHQMVLNLAVNARQAMASGGELTFETSSCGDGSMFCLSVRDTGPGVPRDLRERIFEPMFTTRSAGGGSGIGLYVVKRVAAAHGGRVELAPTDAGAEFRVHLPLQREETRSGAPAGA